MNPRTAAALIAALFITGAVFIGDPPPSPTPPSASATTAPTVEAPGPRHSPHSDDARPGAENATEGL